MASTRTRLLASITVIASSFFVSGCLVGSTTGLAGPPPFDAAGWDSSSQDASADLGELDSSVVDAGSDAALDAGDGAVVDAGVDSGVGMDAGVDSGVGVDAGVIVDAGVDAGSDSGVDAGCSCSGTLSCCGSCVDLTADANNCGKCGVVCASGSYCSASKCCPTGQVNCGNICVNLLLSTSNCGYCGNVCPLHPPVPASCVNGSCR